MCLLEEAGSESVGIKSRGLLECLTCRLRFAQINGLIPFLVWVSKDKSQPGHLSQGGCVDRGTTGAGRHLTNSQALKLGREYFDLLDFKTVDPRKISVIQKYRELFLCIYFFLFLNTSLFFSVGAGVFFFFLYINS